MDNLQTTRASISTRFCQRCAGGILRTAREKWIDGTALILTILYQMLFGKPTTFWEGAQPFVWLLCLIFAVHAVRGTFQLWREISSQPTVREEESPILLPDATKSKKSISVPRPPFFRPKLMGLLLVSLILMYLPCYCVRRVAIASLRTYIYLVPTAELVECQKRAFFIKTVGPQILHNVEIVLKDNKSGKTYRATYPEIGPGSRSSEIYFWFAPTSPWDEDYTVTVAARESHSSQKLIARSAQHQLQFAMQVTVSDEKKPALSCRDRLLPESYTLVTGKAGPCSGVMQLKGDELSALDVDSYQAADGSLRVRRVRQLPSPSDLDDQSDDRHITEYQHQIIEPVLKRYGKSHLLIYFAGGQKSKAYAEEFRVMFQSRNWKVKGPTLVPIGDERIIDVQMSVNYEENWNKYNPKPQDILNAFEKAGIKQRSNLAVDANVPHDWIVLWIGPRSPKDVRPDQCAPPEMTPAEGSHGACEMVSQIDRQKGCPFPPQ